MQELMVQYGCGLSSPSGWKNFDASPTLRIQKLPVIGPMLTRGRPVFPASVRFGDVVAGLPVADGAAKAVYCSHVLEHLSLKDFRTSIAETYRILASGGIFRGVVPDIERLIADYNACLEPDAALRFMRGTLLGQEARPRGIRAFLTGSLGNSEHRWMWDYKAMAAELEAAGFRDIRRAVFGDSANTQFNAVEDRYRWDGCLGFECRK